MAFCAGENSCRGGAIFKATESDQDAGHHPKASNSSLRELRTGTSSGPHAMCAAETLVWRNEPLVSVNCSYRDGFHVPRWTFALDVWS